MDRNRDGCLRLGVTRWTTRTLHGSAMRRPSQPTPTTKGESGHLLGSGAASARADMLGNWVRDSLRDISDEQPDDPGPLRALAFVTTREVSDEELFLNYRLNPKNSYPPWYTPVDLAEDRRRWQRK